MGNRRRSANTANMPRMNSRPPWPAAGRYILLVAVAAVMTLLMLWAIRLRTPTSTGNSSGSLTSSSPAANPPAEVSTTTLQLAPLARRVTAAQSRVEDTAARMDPRRDAWKTEVLSDQASDQLHRLGQLWQTYPTGERDVYTSLVVDAFRCTSLRPAPLVEVYRDSRIKIWRNGGEITSAHTGEPHEGLEEAAQELMTALGTGRQIKFKIYRIAAEEDRFVTDVRYEGRCRQDDVCRQQTAQWVCHWSYPEDAASAPKLLAIHLQRYEEAEIAGPGGPLFTDGAPFVIGGNPNYRTQVLVGIDAWLTRMPREFMGQFGHNGLAIGDVNGDGREDVYVCDSGGLPNRLYVQQPDGTARDMSADAGVDFLEDSTGALLVDLDNDGDQDLVVAADPIVQIAENDGTGRFALRDAIQVNTDTMSLSAADYDGDADLDLYVCGYNVRRQDPTQRGLPFPLPYYDANNGGPNLLLRNEGRLQFVDATAAVGLDENNSRFSMAAAWEDFDDDGDQDLFVANDFGRDNLYRNEGGRFQDIAVEAGVADHGAGMSVSWGDYNRDGRMDLYVGNMFSGAGGRVTYQNEFATGQSAQAVVQLRHMARGNSLFANLGEGKQAKFADVSEVESVTMGRWAWSSLFADLTNDGWPDLVVANGFVTNTDPDDL